MITIVWHVIIMVFSTRECISLSVNQTYHMTGLQLTIARVSVIIEMQT